MRDPLHDPLRHCPQLRGRIVAAETSIYRALDPAVLDEKLRANGLDLALRRSDEERERTRRELLEGREGGDVWVFAYGSLMWDPALHFAEVRVGELDGYHRRFCLKTMLGRGNRERPGLMAGLDRGGDCKGLCFRIDRDNVEAETAVLWRREMVFRSYAPQFVPMQTPQGRIEAIAFVVDHHAQNYLGDLSFEDTARMIGTGKGEFGTNLSYVENLVEQFAALGVEDAELLALRDRAREIAAATLAAAKTG